MPIQTIFSSSQIGTMRERIETEIPVLEEYADSARYRVPEDIQLLNTLIEIPEELPVLHVGKLGSADDDADNAIKVYEYLGSLGRTQAADPRLWTTLTHTTFWSYCRERWPAKDKAPGHVLDHWFEKRGGGRGALGRNAISRLWWAANLTVAPWEHESSLHHLKSSDRFKFTRVLLSQQQIFQDITEREFGSNLHLRIFLLNSLGKHMPSVSNKDNLSIATSKQLLLTLKSRHVETLPTAEAEKVIEKIVEATVSRQNTT